MTLGQKIQALRKGHGWTQEELAGKIAVSRQALSKWESDVVIPETENIIQLGRIFHVSTDYLLLDDCGSEDSMPASGPEGKTRVIVGACIVGVSLLGLLIIGILSSVLDAVYIEKPADVEWVRAYSGLLGFLKTYRLGWLFILCVISAVCGFLLILRPRFEKLTRQLATLWRRGRREK